MVNLSEKPHHVLWGFFYGTKLRIDEKLAIFEGKHPIKFRK